MHRYLLLFVALTLGSVALADVPPPNRTACDGKRVGQACTTNWGRAGTCRMEECSRLDYSNGTPPGTVTYDCLLCVAAKKPAAPAPAPAPEPAPEPAPAAAESAAAPAPAPTLAPAPAVALKATAPATVAPVAEAKASSCAALPGFPLGVGALVVALLSRRRRCGA
jgi:hypothetical protein